jgi:hypothetical protein
VFPNSPDETTAYAAGVLLMNGTVEYVRTGGGNSTWKLWTKRATAQQHAASHRDRVAARHAGWARREGSRPHKIIGPVVYDVNSRTIELAEQPADVPNAGSRFDRHQPAVWWSVMRHDGRAYVVDTMHRTVARAVADLRADSTHDAATPPLLAMVSTAGHLTTRLPWQLSAELVIAADAQPAVA